MKLSIITVTFNSSLTLADTLSSVSSQNYPDIEYIVVDGGSTDSTLELIKSSNTVNRHISEPDEGIYDAMNKGLKLATGDVIGFLHSDDVYAHPGVLSLVAKRFEELDLDALYGDIVYFQNNPGRKGGGGVGLGAGLGGEQVGEQGGKRDVVRRYRSHRFAPNMIGWGWMPAHPSLFLKRGVYDTYGLFKTDYKIAGDYEFVARIFHANLLKYHYLSEVLVKMRMGGVSTGGLSNSIILNQEVLRACRENGIPTNWFKILSKYPAKLLDSIFQK